MAFLNPKVVITGEDQSGKAFSSLKSNVEKSTDASKQFATGLAVLGTAVAGFGLLSVKAFMESQQSLAQLDAVLTSTGGAAGVTRDEVIALSDEMMNLTGVSDEAAIQMQSMLLTFTNIGKDIFPRVAKTTLDMATAMNGGAIPSAEELRKQAIQLGKALQDPDQGLGALKRVGVNVDELAKKFTEGMSVQEKQILILDELQTEFGGSAKAAGETFGGQLNIAKENFGNLMEEIGKGIVEGIRPLVEAFNKWFKEAGGVEGVMKGLKEKLQWIVDNGPVIATTITFILIPAFASLGAVIWGIIATLGPFALIGFAVGLLAQEVIKAQGGWDAFVKNFKEGIEGIKVVLRPILKDINQFKEGLIDVKEKAQLFTAGFKEGLIGIREAIADVINWLNDMKRKAGEALAKFSESKLMRRGLFGILPFQFGGYAEAGQPIMVGEAGPELFVPSSSGTVKPQGSFGAGGSGGNTNIVVNIGMYAGTETEKRRIAEDLLKAVGDRARARNIGLSQYLEVI